MRDATDHLAAIVTLWLTNGNTVIDGANDPREFTDSDWYDAMNLTEDLIQDGFLEYDFPDEAERYHNEGGTYAMVVPTPKGIFEVLR